MPKYKIELVTMKDIMEFVAAVSKFEEEVYLVDKFRKFRVSAKSQLAAMLSSAEWAEIYAESDADIYQAISKWVV